VERDVSGAEPSAAEGLSDDVLDEPPEPVVSAIAMAGIVTTAAPIPRATARAPTRPIVRSRPEAMGPAGLTICWGVPGSEPVADWAWRALHMANPSI